MKHGTRTYSDIMQDPIWSGMSTPPGDRIQMYGGTGLRPYDFDTGLHNVIIVNFIVLPHGVCGNQNIKFDLTRRSDVKICVLDIGNNYLRGFGPYANSSSQTVLDEPNDDPNTIDESDEPDQGDHMYSKDPPGYVDDTLSEDWTSGSSTAATLRSS